MGEIERNEKSNVKKAMELHLQALEIYKSANEEQSQGCSNVLHNMGNVYADQGNYKSALDCYNKALTIRVKIFGKDSG